jgi:hypothetical protein
MRSLGGATECSTPSRSTPPELRGHVVLVDFWTWTCINWLRQEPYVRASSQAYRTTGWLSSASHTVANAVQNGIIGDDDSVTGGVRGASALFVLNGPLAVVLFRRSKLRRLAEGTPRTLISMGVVDHEALRRERLTEVQLNGRHRDAGGRPEFVEAVESCRHLPRWLARQTTARLHSALTSHLPGSPSALTARSLL